MAVITQRPRSVSITHATATAAAASSTALAAPATGQKRSYLLIQNVEPPGGETAWLRCDGTPATAAAPCIRLLPGASFGGTNNVVQGEITCIRNAAADLSLSVLYEEIAS